MSINAVSNGNSGISQFHAHHARKHHQPQIQPLPGQKPNHKADGSDLLAAVDAAFRSYIAGQDAQHQAMINAVAGYALTPNGKGAMPVTKAEQAPFLALSVMA